MTTRQTTVPPEAERATRRAAEQMRHQIDDEMCRSASRILELVGRRWNSGILLALGRGASRFSEITRSVSGLSDRMASVRLKELEHARLVERVVEPTTPVSIHYRLTRRGQELLDALQPISRYGVRWESR
ncbi:helix-turn-helix domain-containing protein [Nocardioides sp. KR10-350]|uniref:winged helix-turn-helix transcriptional regulator n=1 Tax=Nocardioides cheoyonin TaxID=3156615 RepID=UPI0032B4DEB3